MCLSFAVATVAAILLMIFFVGLRDRLRTAAMTSATVALIVELGVLGSVMLNELIYLAFGWQVAAANPRGCQTVVRGHDSRTTDPGPAGGDLAGCDGDCQPTLGSTAHWHAIVGCAAALVMAGAGLAFAQTRDFSPDV
jgi:hypothetical protein